MDYKIHKNRVYILNPTGHDYSNAGEYGEINYVFIDKTINVFALRKRIAEIKESMVDIEETDYIVISGYPILNSIMLAYALNKLKSINVLLFNAKDKKYVPRTVESKACRYED